MIYLSYIQFILFKMTGSIGSLTPFLIVLSNLLLLGILSAIINEKLPEKQKFKYVYHLSKILTVKTRIIESHNSEILDGFSDFGEAYGLSLTYRNFLKLIENKKCIENYKKCGILDTIGNPLCIDELVPCPINKMNVDNIVKKDYYLGNNYQTAPLSNMSHNHAFFYSNDYEEGEGKVIMIKTKDEPKYFTYNNFVVDTDAYKERFGELEDIKILDDILDIFDDNDNNNDNNNDNDLDKVIKIVQIINDLVDETSLYIKGAKALTTFFLYYYNKQVEKFEKYIKEKFEDLYDENNIDIYYSHIGDNFYTKNFIGFKNSQELNKFMKFDYKIYKKIFPNYTAAGWATVSIVMICINIRSDFPLFFPICIKQNNNNNDQIKCNIGVVLLNSFFILPIALGFFIYSVVTYVQVNKNKDLNELKSIESDEFIKGFINEFVSLCQKGGLILSCIIITGISFVMNVISLILFFKNSCDRL